MINESGQLDIYKIETNKKINKKKIAIIILCFFILICLIITINNCIKVMEGYKVYKQYEAQLQSITFQEEQKQVKIREEKERKRQEKIPKLTQERKNKYRKHLSFRK